MATMVREVMKSDVYTVNTETPLPKIERRFAETKVGALPVVERNRKLLGIVSRTDVVRRHSLEQALAELSDSHFDSTLGVDEDDDALAAIGEAVGRRLSKVIAKDIMISDVVTVGPDAHLLEAAERMLERKIHRLPVVENGVLIGIVSAFDFLRVYVANPT